MSVGSDEDRKAGRIAIGLGVVVALAAGGWWWWQRSQVTPPVTAEEAAVIAPQEVATVEPEGIQHPLEPAAPDAPAAATPDAAPVDADALTLAAMTEVFGGGMAEWLVTEQLARRVVATVDNLGRTSSLEKVRPVRAPSSPFAVERDQQDVTAGTERIVISPTNAERYDALVAMLQNTDAAAASAAYRRVYPQLQRAYEDLGYPGRYFNDRVVAVIDHLLATPEPTGELLLEQPKVLYHFADADLEARSPGQKALLRIGVDHARVVKSKLREFRAHIAAAAPKNNN